MKSKVKTTTTTTARKEKGWALIQVRAETHQLLKEYCDEHGYKMSALTNKLIKEYLKIN
jgi:hypothetical protein